MRDNYFFAINALFSKKERMYAKKNNHKSKFFT